VHSLGHNRRAVRFAFRCLECGHVALAAAAPLRCPVCGSGVWEYAPPRATAAQEHRCQPTAVSLARFGHHAGRYGTLDERKRRLIQPSRIRTSGTVGRVLFRGCRSRLLGFTADAEPFERSLRSCRELVWTLAAKWPLNRFEQGLLHVLGNRSLGGVTRKAIGRQVRTVLYRGTCSSERSPPASEIQTLEAGAASRSGPRLWSRCAPPGRVTS
jgi:hypothetical protein